MTVAPAVLLNETVYIRDHGTASLGVGWGDVSSVPDWISTNEKKKGPGCSFTRRSHVVSVVALIDVCVNENRPRSRPYKSGMFVHSCPQVLLGPTYIRAEKVFAAPTWAKGRLGVKEDTGNIYVFIRTYSVRYDAPPAARACRVATQLFRKNMCHHQSNPRRICTRLERTRRTKAAPPPNTYIFLCCTESIQNGGVALSRYFTLRHLATTTKTNLSVETSTGVNTLNCITRML